MQTEWIRRAGGFALGLGLAMLAQSPAMAGQAVAGRDVFQTTYFDVATSSVASRAGYGGPGVSGGAGDNTVRITNPTSGNRATGTGGATSDGTLCAMIYVFDDFEEMQTCCGCPVSPDGLRTISVTNDLTFNFGVNKGNLNAGVIDIISSLLNFDNSNPLPGPTPPGTNLFCSPTGSYSNDPFGRAGPVNPVPGLRSWITHDEVQKPGNIVGGKSVQSVSVEEFLTSFLDGTEFDGTHFGDLQQRCEFLIANGSGAGVCTCGTGESFGAFGATAGR